jgi:Na+/phosphate symporter
MSIQAFTKTGNTVVFTAATSAPTPVQCLSTTLGGNQYRIINAGSITVFLGYGMTSADAANSAVIVTSSGSAFPLLAGTDEILTFIPNAYFTGITGSSTASVYITPGDGM